MWHWGAAEQRAFEDLKESFLRHVVLAFPDRNKPYILYTDASDTGVGAMLCQEDDEKRLRLVVCMSRKLNKHEVNYTVHEKELLALVESTTKWGHYLHDSQSSSTPTAPRSNTSRPWQNRRPARSDGYTDFKSSIFPFTISPERRTS